MCSWWWCSQPCCMCFSLDVQYVKPFEDVTYARIWYTDFVTLNKHCCRVVYVNLFLNIFMARQLLRCYFAKKENQCTIVSCIEWSNLNLVQTDIWNCYQMHKRCKYLNPDITSHPFFTPALIVHLYLENTLNHVLYIGKHIFICGYGNIML